MSRKTKKKGKACKHSQKEFTAKTRLFDLVRKEYHQELRQFIADISDMLPNVYPHDWKTFKTFEVDEDVCSKTDVIISIASFLYKIGKGAGLKCKMSVFIRYLTSTEHGNFELKERSLNTLIYRMFNYLEYMESRSKKL